jgi:hypothetical protein
VNWGWLYVRPPFSTPMSWPILNLPSFFFLLKWEMDQPAVSLCLCFADIIHFIIGNVFVFLYTLSDPPGINRFGLKKLLELFLNECVSFIILVFCSYLR